MKQNRKVLYYETDNNYLNTMNNKYDNFFIYIKILKRAIMKSNSLSKEKMLSRITFSNRQFILHTGGRINRESILHIGGRIYVTESFMRIP